MMGPSFAWRVALSLAALSGARAGSGAGEEDVLVLTAATIEQATKDNPFLVVEYYAPWCGHCKKLAPEYEAAAPKAKELGITFAKMDSVDEANVEFRRGEEVNGFPTFRAYEGSIKSGKTHNPPRDSEGLVAYFKAIKAGEEPPKPPAPARPPAEKLEEPEDSEVVVLDDSNFKDWIKDQPFAAVEFYAPWCGHCRNLFPEYTKASILLKDSDPPVKLAKVDADDDASQEISDEYEIMGFPTVHLFRNGELEANEYRGPRKAEGMAEWLKALAAGLPPPVPSREDDEYDDEYEDYDDEEYDDYEDYDDEDEDEGGYIADLAMGEEEEGMHEEL